MDEAMIDHLEAEIRSLRRSLDRLDDCVARELEHLKRRIASLEKEQG